MEERDATIMIPGYGPGYLTDQCLMAVALTCRPGQIFVWDNGIDHQDLTENQEPEVTRLLDQIYARSQEGRDLTGGVWNLGFAEACNRMAAEATTDLLVFLNCDTEPQPDWLATLVRAFDEPDVGVAGLRMTSPDGTLRHSGVRVILGGGLAWARESAEDLPTRDVPAVTGACLAIRPDVFEAVGGFDAEFWNVFEDVDLCLRVLQLGYRVRYIREALVIHAVEATGEERYTRVFPQVVRFQKKWANSHVLSSS